MGFGPRLWLGCCGVYLQPSEPLKLLLIVFLAGCAKEGVQPRQEMPAVVPATGEPEVTPMPSVLKTVEVNLTADKLMIPDNIKIKKGTAVRFFNREEKYYHNLIIYSADVEKPMASDVIAQSSNINPGEYWEYVFERSGEYVVKDIYSGTMRGEITAEVVSEILEKGEIIGTISVE